MHATSIFMILSAGTLSAADQMNISVCNLGGASQQALKSAEAEASAFFQAAKVDVSWKSCDELPESRSTAVRWFVLRLRDIKPFSIAVTNTSLDVMGRAFVADDLEGGMADAYFEAIKEFARRYDADVDALLGYVIVHELGHLLLGPGHVTNGVNVMRARWSPGELRALRQRWLRFSKLQEASIHHALQRNHGAVESVISPIGVGLQRNDRK
jgi:hypothetical protein